MTLNVTTIITVNGTKRSERGGGLDDGESSQFTIEPGEYDPRLGLGSVADLIAHIEHNAWLRGEWISLLRIDGADLVGQEIADALRESHGNVQLAMEVLREVPMFCNAGAGDLLELVMSRAGTHSGV